MFALLQLCDSLFPIGAFSHSDGLEAATAGGAVRSAADLRLWMDSGLEEALGRADGPAVWHAWHLAAAHDWPRLAALDAEAHALRTSASARAASRGMGSRLVRTWRQIRPAALLDELVAHAGVDLTLPVAFGSVAAAADIPPRMALEGYIYTRLAGTVSSAMRLMAIGQHEAHALLAESLLRASTVVDRIAGRRVPGHVPSAVRNAVSDEVPDLAPEAASDAVSDARSDDAPLMMFAPALDIAAMGQQYVHSRLFRS